jgi:hypothetical protein
MHRSLTISGKDVTDQGLTWLCGHGLGEDDLPPFQKSKKDEPSFRHREGDNPLSFFLVNEKGDDRPPLRYNKKDDIYHRDSEDDDLSSSGGKRGGQPTNKTICQPR